MDKTKKIVYQTSLRIGTTGHPVSLSINIDESLEPLYKKATDYINERINHYALNFPNLAHDTYSAMLLIDLAIRLMQVNENYAEVEKIGNEVLDALNKTLEKK